MALPFSPGVKGPRMDRREFIRWMSLAAAGVAAGCAVNPVTGESQLMLVSERDEIQIDKTSSPHQFSADYGVTQDRDLDAYIHRTGRDMGVRTHRPRMPYAFHCVNAPYVNAYAFPGGTIACTRGILLELENEAELAALLGHELGHVNSRHTAHQMSQNMLISAAAGGLSTVASTGDSLLGGLVSGLAGIGAGALLAKYSRDNERQADALAVEYMVRTEYSPDGMLGLMEMLNKESGRGSNAFQLLFSTHPMGKERYAHARERVETQYRAERGRPVHRERYMDHTARLRTIRDAVESMQEGDKALSEKDVRGAEGHYRRALKVVPRDYTALVKMAECQVARKQYTDARSFAEKAQQVYPGEARAYHVSGVSRLMERDFDGAHEEFSLYEKHLPGNPNTLFLLGFSLEGMGRRKEAAQEYYQYLKQVSRGDPARYAYQRLVEWGYIRPQNP